MKIITDWKDFFKFLKQPDYITERKEVLSKILLTFNSFILKYLLIIPFFIAYTVYIQLTGDFPKTNHENVIKIFNPIILYTT